MIGRFPLAVILLLVVAPLGACSRFKAPTFSAVSVSPGQTTPEGFVVDFTLEAHNNNSEAVPLHVAKYTLLLDGAPVFTGQRSPEITIARYDSQEFILPAVIPLDAVSPGAMDYQIRGVISYVTPGALAETLFDARVRIPEAPLSIAGEMHIEP